MHEAYFTYSTTLFRTAMPLTTPTTKSMEVPKLFPRGALCLIEKRTDFTDNQLLPCQCKFSKKEKRPHCMLNT